MTIEDSVKTLEDIIETLKAILGELTHASIKVDHLRKENKDLKLALEHADIQAIQDRQRIIELEADEASS